MNKQFDPGVFSAMQTGNPIGTYQKTVISKVNVQILNPFTGEPNGSLLTGKPGEDESIYRSWSDAEDVFFTRQNRRLFKEGLIIRIESKKDEPEADVPLEQSSDEEVLKIINSRFNAVQNILQKTDSEAFVNRLLEAARREEKSERFVKAIETRLAELQFTQLKQE
jgi:hypothetical protein